MIQEPAAFGGQMMTGDINDQNIDPTHAESTISQ
jgi:hypothetical protein